LAALYLFLYSVTDSISLFLLIFSLTQSFKPFPYTTLFRSTQIERSKNIINSKYKHVDIIFGTNNIHKLPQLIMAHEQTGDMIIEDRKSTRLNSSHVSISYAVFCLK